MRNAGTLLYRQQFHEAFQFLAKALELEIPGEEGRSLAIILGSGLGDFADTLEEAKKIPFSQIPHFPHSSIAGHTGVLVWGSLGKQRVCCLQGRSHYYEGQGMAAVTFPVRVLRLLGVRKLIVTNAAGGLNPRFRPGDLMLIRDHLGLFVPNPLVGANEEEFGPRFPDMSQCYSPSLRRIALQCGRALKLTLREGVYAAVTGPSYETPAEICLLRRLGADAVGMSTVPEVIVARHMGIECLGISGITNLAAGASKIPLCHEEVLKAGGKINPQLIHLLTRICRKLSREEVE